MNDESDKITFCSHKTANYCGLTTTSIINIESISIGSESLTPGDKIIQLGSKKRSRFTMQDNHFLEYAGFILYNNSKHLLFKSDGLDVEERGYLWYYSFVFIKPDILILGDRGQAFDLRVDVIVREVNGG